MGRQRLFSVPQPCLMEAPSSWLPRAAISQGESIRTVGKFLGFSASGDCDEQLLAMQPLHLATLCGLSPDLFGVVLRMLDLALSLELQSPVLLCEGNLPKYRFCPECLWGYKTPHFPLHWRLDAYRLCHLHKCFLEDYCPHCGAIVCPQQDWMQSGAARCCVDMASQCLVCSKFLWDTPSLNINAISRKLLPKNDRKRLENGYTFATALFYERLEIRGQELTDVRSALTLADKWGQFASGTHLCASHFRKAGAAQVDGPVTMADMNLPTAQDS